MSVDSVLFWLLTLSFCELALAASMGAALGSGAVILLVVCGWLARLDLDLLALLLAASYSSVLVCLSLVQTSLDGYPGAAHRPARSHWTLVGDLALLGLASLPGLGNAQGSLPAFLLADLPQGEGDWLEEVIGAFHLFFYRTATLEAIFLNLFLLLALVTSLGLLHFAASSEAAPQGPSWGGMSRIRTVRAFRRQVRRKNASQIRPSRS